MYHLQQLFMFSLNLIVCHALTVTYGRIGYAICIGIFFALYTYNEAIENSELIGILSIFGFGVALLGGYRMNGYELLLSTLLFSLMVVYYGLSYKNMVNKQVETTLIVGVMICLGLLLIFF